MSDEKLGVAIEMVELESRLALIWGNRDDRPNGVVKAFGGVKLCVRITVGNRVVHFVHYAIADNSTNVRKRGSELIVVG